MMLQLVCFHPGSRGFLSLAQFFVQYAMHVASKPVVYFDTILFDVKHHCQLSIYQILAC